MIAEFWPFENTVRLLSWFSALVFLASVVEDSVLRVFVERRYIYAAGWFLQLLHWQRVVPQ